MWSLDLARCYRQWRADPLDWPLLGITWGKNYYIDISIAFGLRHGAAFAQRVSTAVCDILAREGHTALSYIDDFLGTQKSYTEADVAFTRAVGLFHELGLEQAAAKSVAPTTSITWIGVAFDTVAMEMSIPPQVLTDTRDLVLQWSTRARASRHDLQVLLGRLFHAAKCSPPARLFVGRMLHTLRAAPSQGTISLPPGFRLDLDWFATFLPSYNGIQFIIPLRPKVHLQILTTPTLLKAVWEDKEVVDALPSILSRAPFLAFKELFTILVAFLLWGSEWANWEVHIYTKSPAKVDVLVHGKTRDLSLLHIARCIWLITARHDIVLKPCNQFQDKQPVNCKDKWAVPQTALDILHNLV
jgi:hypothetical protein